MPNACLTRPPGSGFRGPLPPLSVTQRVLEQELRDDVEALATGIGPRALGEDPSALHAARLHLAEQLRAIGYEVLVQEFEAGGETCANLAVELVGGRAATEIVVVGAHYDTVPGSPGADDNASGVAALLALARRLRGLAPDRTLRLVLFTNEEHPWADAPTMGSRVYADACAARGEDVVAMISLDVIGYYSDEPGTQGYPFPLNLFYPDTGDFIGFVTNGGSKALLFDAIASFREHVDFPSEGVIMNNRHVGRSDHASFWRAGYPAILLTVGGNFRDPNYHSPQDTAEALDYGRLSRVVEGLEAVLLDLLGAP